MSPGMKPVNERGMAALIELAQVRRTYRMGDVEVPALKDVSLSIAPGECIAIMGSSGSGKSTLMNILGCLDKPDAGRYTLDGHDVTQLSKDELALIRNKTLGFVFQNFNLLSRTSALENVELPLLYAGIPAAQRHARARAALERVGLGTRLDHPPSRLSGGQQQRVAIARALVGAPRVVLADEPTGNLDSRTSIEIMALLQELTATGITVILVTHEHDIAAYAQRVVLLKDGVVARDESQLPARAVVGAA
jgi:putative ABC transport system ATP-binding protein